MLYQAYQAHTDWLWPLRSSASAAAPWLADTRHGARDWPPVRRAAAWCELISLVQMTHRRPAFGIDEITVDGVPRRVVEEAAYATPFGTLLHFRKPGVEGQPPLLIVAPMSGHFATLLRETVRVALADHDVYITDWHNARDVPLAAGRFGLDEYVLHLVDFLGRIGPGAHLLAICQPCVPALAAVSLMAEDDHPATPRSMTLMAGPIDCRVAPTEVNKLATGKPIDWFESHLLGTVPLRFRGALRRVYPGFMQLTAFMSMNMDRHLQSLKTMYEQMANGEHDQAEPTRRFYEEYFAVADLPAEFYIETVRRVFQDYELARGVLEVHGRPVRPQAIRRTALLTVEGERDDICALGQTLAAHDLCAGIRPYLKSHYVQPGAGHYGVFSGKRWENQIYPLVRDTIHNAAQ